MVAVVKLTSFDTNLILTDFFRVMMSLDYHFDMIRRVPPVSNMPKSNFTLTKTKVQFIDLEILNFQV